MNPHPPPAGPHVNPHPSLTRLLGLNSRHVQTGPQFPAGPDWASIPGRSRLGLNSRQSWVHMPSCAPPPGFTCPPAPRHLGSHALLRPATWVHMPSCAPPPGFTCPPAPRHLGSHALLRPATWVHMPSCAPPPGFHMPSCALPPGLHMPSCAPPPGFHMPSCAPPPGFHMPSCAQAPGFHIALLDRTTTQTTPQSAQKPFTNPTSA